MHTDQVAETRVRTVRVDDKLWETAQEVAKQRRESVADVLRRALVDYCESAGREVTW